MKLTREAKQPETITIVSDYAEMRFTIDGRSLVTITPVGQAHTAIQRMTENDEEARRLLDACEAKKSLVFTGTRKSITMRSTTYHRFEASAWMEVDNANISGV